jgi:D-tyrosyl-tRNA(Tyr) deacylase
MIALLQRVSRASVAVSGVKISRIEHGLLVLLGVEKGDTEVVAERMVERILGYRMFADADDKMNLDVTEVKGGVLLVPQFTLTADTWRGRRPSFSSAADPATGRQLFDSVVDIMRRHYDLVETGQFGADMAVELINDGPVTFWLQA